MHEGRDGGGRAVQRGERRHGEGAPDENELAVVAVPDFGNSSGPVAMVSRMPMNGSAHGHRNALPSSAAAASATSGATRRIAADRPPSRHRLIGIEDPAMQVVTIRQCRAGQLRRQIAK